MNFVIITPSYNQVEFLKRCIASVADQVSDEIFIHHHVQDGGSSDGTCEFLKDYARQIGSMVSRRYAFSYKRVSDNGMYDALNKGIEYALEYAPWQVSEMSGDKQQPLISKLQISNTIFAWLNCDEQYLLGSLKKVFDYFQQCPTTDFLYGNTLHVNSEGKFLTYRKNPPLRKLYVRTDHLYIQSASTFFRASIFDEGARFDTSLKAISDCVFIINLLEKKKVARHINDYLSIFTMTGDNLSIEDVGLKELKYWHDAAPGFIRLFRPIINGFRYLEKGLSGGYSEKFPLMYSIYLNDNDKRERIVTNSGSWQFTWGH
ncbi:MAG: glycosyltransferase [Pontiellaceae bacterium]